MQYAVTDWQGRVFGFIDAVATPTGVDGEVRPVNDPVKCFPEAPHDGAVLYCIDGVLSWTDLRSTTEAQDQAWERIKAARAVAEYGSFTCDGAVYDGDEASTRRIAGATTLALLAQMAGAPYSIDWTLADNTIKTLDAAGMIAVGVAAGAHVGAVYNTGRALREQIEAATSVDELALIAWPATE